MKGTVQMGALRNGYPSPAPSGPPVPGGSSNPTFGGYAPPPGANDNRLSPANDNLRRSDIIRDLIRLALRRNMYRLAFELGWRIGEYWANRNSGLFTAGGQSRDWSGWILQSECIAGGGRDIKYAFGCGPSYTSTIDGYYNGSWADPNSGYFGAGWSVVEATPTREPREDNPEYMDFKIHRQWIWIKREGEVAPPDPGSESGPQGWPDPPPVLPEIGSPGVPGQWPPPPPVVKPPDWADSSTGPIGLPSTGRAPLPPPIKIITERTENPNQSPTERSTWGNAAPNTPPVWNASPRRLERPQTQGFPQVIDGVLPVDPTMAGEKFSWSPTSGARISPNSYRWAKPPRNTLERKTIVSIAKRAISTRVFGAVTEYSDAVDALYDAIPKHLRNRHRFKKYLGLDGKSKLIVMYWGDIDLNEALDNLITNEIQDRIIGKLGRESGKLARKTGRPHGYSLGKAL